MERYPAQPSYELVLDARRLIIACVLVIFVCGVFFVLGFVEGKRQVLQASLNEPGTAPPATTEPATPPGVPGAAKVGTTVPETPSRQADQQSWYDKVNAQAQQAKPQPRTGTPATKPAAPVPSKPAVTSPAPAPKTAGTVLYSCQVGAFRQQNEAQIKVKELNSRGYNAVIDPPESPGGFYLLKVGRYATRAEAVAMQSRLKKAGYDSFIKTSR
jgi:cell division protein FtsN